MNREMMSHLAQHDAIASFRLLAASVTLRLPYHCRSSIRSIEYSVHLGIRQDLIVIYLRQGFEKR